MRAIMAFLCCLSMFPICYVANSKIGTETAVIQPEPKDLRWNRYVTKNFEILSLDDAQGSYLSNNVEHMKTWILWRWGIKDSDLQVRCKLVCVPSTELYQKLFNKNAPSWKVDVVNGAVEGVVWINTDSDKWNVYIPVFLTEVLLANLEVSSGRKLPVWCHRGMSVLNGRIGDIRTSASSVSGFNSKNLLEMTQEAYGKLTDAQKTTFDAHAASFCLWARQEHNGKVFLNFLSGAMVNPEWSLQYFNLKTYQSCDAVVQVYLQKLATGSDYYFSW